MKLEKPQLVLKLVLEELGVVNSWKEVNLPLVRRVLEGLNKRGGILHFSYYGLSGYCDLSRELYGPFLEKDLMDIEMETGTEESFGGDRLIPTAKKFVEDYKSSEDFRALVSKYDLSTLSS